MILSIAKHESIGGIQNGVYYFHLSNYPQISALELKIAVAFIMYEKSYNRKTEIVCNDKQILVTVKDAVANPSAIGPFVLSEETEFVYHATGLNGARKIFYAESCFLR